MKSGLAFLEEYNKQFKFFTIFVKKSNVSLNYLNKALDKENEEKSIIEQAHLLFK